MEICRSNWGMFGHIGEIMSIQVDLILPEEQRNASAFNMQALMRILSIVGPAVLILLIIMLIISFMTTSSELKNLEIQWQTLEVKKDKADNLRNQISDNKEVLSKLKGIRNSRIEWHKQLINFMAATPKSIQLNKLSISQDLKLDERKQSIRAYKVSLAGKATGNKVDITVAGFNRILSTSPLFTPYIELAQVTDYEKDNSSDAEKNDRVFTIDCTYKPRIFE